MSVRYTPFVDWLEQKGHTYESWLAMDQLSADALVGAWLWGRLENGRSTAEAIADCLLTEPDRDGSFRIQPGAYTAPAAAAIGERMVDQALGAKACREALRSGRLAARGPAGGWHHPGTDIITAEELHIAVDCGGCPPTDGGDALPETDEQEWPDGWMERVFPLVLTLALGLLVIGVADQVGRYFGWWSIQ